MHQGLSSRPRLQRQRALSQGVACPAKKFLSLPVRPDSQAEREEIDREERKPLAVRGRTTGNAGAMTRCAATERWFHPCASSGSEPLGVQTRCHPAQQKVQKSRKHLPSAVFQLARRARSQQLA